MSKRYSHSGKSFNAKADTNFLSDPLRILPCELQSRILGLLDCRSLAACRLVSSHWLARVDCDSHLWSAVGLRIGLRRRPSRDHASDRRFVQETAAKCRLSCAWIDCAEGEVERRRSSESGRTPELPAMPTRVKPLWRLVCLRVCQIPGRQTRLHLWHYAPNTGRLSEANSCQSAQLLCPAGSLLANDDNDEVFRWWPGALSSGCHVGGHLGCLADCGGVACAVAQPTSSGTSSTGQCATLIRLPLAPFSPSPTSSKWSTLDLTGCSGRLERLTAIAVHTCVSDHNTGYAGSTGRRNSLHSRQIASTVHSCQVALGLTASNRLMAWIVSDKSSLPPDLKTPIAASLQLAPLATQHRQQCHEQQLQSDPSQCRLWCLSESSGRRLRRRNLRRRRVSLSTLMPSSLLSRSQQPRRCFVAATLTNGSAVVVQLHCSCCCCSGGGGDCGVDGGCSRDSSRAVHLQCVARIGGDDDMLVRDILPFDAPPPPDAEEFDNLAEDNLDCDSVGFTALMTSASTSTANKLPTFWLREFVCRDDCKPLASSSASTISEVPDAWIFRSSVAYQLPGEYERLVLCAAGRTFLCVFASHWSAGAALLLYRRATAAPLCFVEFPQYADTFPRYELHPPVWVNQAWFDRGIASKETDSDVEDAEDSKASAGGEDTEESAKPKPLLLFACPMRGFSRCLLLSCSRLGGGDLDAAMATSAGTTDAEYEMKDKSVNSGVRLVACGGLDFTGCKQLARRRSVGLPH